MRQRAFTLIELLVVVAIIVALIAILLPSMGRAIEISNRAVCGSNLHQFHTGILGYVSDHRGAFPDSRRDDGAFHTRYISTPVYDKLLDNVGSADVMTCPNQFPVIYIFPTDTPPSGLGYNLGYVYLGGFDFTGWNTSSPSTHALWDSARRITDSKATKLLADFIYQPLPTVPNPTVGAHGRGGGVRVDAPTGIHPKDVGIEGANITGMGGGVTWGPLDELKGYSAEPGARARNFH